MPKNMERLLFIGALIVGLSALTASIVNLRQRSEIDNLKARVEKLENKSDSDLGN